MFRYENILIDRMIMVATIKYEENAIFISLNDILGM